MLLLLLTVLAAAGVALPGAVADQELAGPSAAYGPPPPPPAPLDQPQAYAAAVAPEGEVGEQHYIQYPSGYGYSEPGFSVQTGYEGYLVPWNQQGHSDAGLGGLGGLGLLGSLLPLPKLGLKLFPKASIFLAGFAVLLLIGGAFTTAVCALTPICTISFLGLGLSRNSMRSYLTPDRLTQTTAFVLDAIDKYKDFSKKVSAKEARSARSSKDRRRR